MTNIGNNVFIEIMDADDDVKNIVIKSPEWNEESKCYAHQDTFSGNVEI